jgi:hypothetical protein
MKPPPPQQVELSPSVARTSGAMARRPAENPSLLSRPSIQRLKSPSSI